MTTPSILPTNFDGTSKDYLKTKSDKSGAVRGQYTTVSVPTGTVITTIVGLVPFNKGFRFSYSSTLYVENIGDTSLTLDIGYVYKTGSSATDDPNAFASALTTGQSGGFVTFDEPVGLGWVAEDDGWIAVTTAGSTTDNTGVIKGMVIGEYDNFIYGQAVN